MTKRPLIRKRDALALMRLHLLGNDELTALVGDRIRTEHVRDPSLLEYPIVILHCETGPSRYHGGLQSFRADLYGYSNESQDAADRVYDLAYHALHAERLWDPSGAIRAAGMTRELERPRSGFNTQTQSYYARGSWLVMLAG